MKKGHNIQQDKIILTFIGLFAHPFILVNKEKKYFCVHFHEQKYLHSVSTHNYTQNIPKHTHTQNKHLYNCTHTHKIKIFSVWLRNRLISTGLKPVLSHTEKYPVFYEYKNVHSKY